MGIALCECQILFSILLWDHSLPCLKWFPHMSALISTLLNIWGRLSTISLVNSGALFFPDPQFHLLTSGSLDFTWVPSPCTMPWKFFQGSKLGQSVESSPCLFSISQGSLSFSAWCSVSLKKSLSHMFCLLKIFLVVLGDRVNLVPFIPSWSETKGLLLSFQRWF